MYVCMCVWKDMATTTTAIAKEGTLFCFCVCC